MKKTSAEVVAELIAKMLDAGISPWHQPWKSGGAMSINGNYYRGINAILLGMQNYQDNRWLTFSKVKELGGFVRKGEKSMPVVFWKFISKTEIDDDGTETKKTFPYAQMFYVFNVEQCDNLKLPARKDFNVNNNPIASAEEIWNNYADKPELKHNIKSAYYNPEDDFISIPAIEQFSSAEAYYATLFHESIHSTGSSKRLDRLTNDKFGSENYGKEELIAEIGAQLILQSIGITRTLENSAAYCKAWSKAIKEMPAISVLSAASQAQKAVDYIFGIKHTDMID